MAQEDVSIQAKLVVDTADSNKRIQEINNVIEEARKQLSQATFGTKEYAEAQKKLDSATSDLTKAQKAFGQQSKDNTSKVGQFADGMKGLAKEQFKALGIFSLITGALNLVKDAFSKNQETANLFSTATTFLSNAFQDFVGFIQENVGSVVDWFKNIFENPKQAVIDFGIAIKNNLVERFESLIKSAGLLGNAIGNLLKGNFKEAADSAKAAGKEFIDVITGVNDSGDKIADAAGKVVDYAKKTWTAAKAQVDLQNAAKLAASKLQGLVEEYDRQAETQRQIRDDEFKSIEERIAANEELGKILHLQQTTMLALADTRVKSAAADLAANKGNVDLQVAYNNALNERKGILAQVNGFLSEQKVNAVALAKEQLDRDKAVLESQNKIAFERKRAAAELITDELVKAETIKRLNQEEAIDELQRLTDNINNTKAGTQARVDAEIAFNEKKKDIDIEAAATDANIAAIKMQRQKDLNALQNQNQLEFLALRRTLIESEVTDQIVKSNKLIQLAQQEHDAKQALIISQRDAEIANAEKLGLDTSAIREKYNTQIAANDAALVQTQKQLSNAIIETKIAEVETVGNLAKGLSNLINQQSAAGKVAAIALATIDTFVAAWRAFRNAQANPISILGPAYPYIAAASAAAAGIANIKKIASVQVPGGASGGGGTPSASTATPPVLPQQTSTRLDAQSIQQVGNAAASGAGRAFVLATDISNTQERDALLARQARLG